MSHEARLITHLWPKGTLLSNSLFSTLNPADIGQDVKSGNKIPHFYKWKREHPGQAIPVGAYSRFVVSGYKNPFVAYELSRSTRRSADGKKPPYDGNDYDLTGYVVATPVTIPVFNGNTYASRKADTDYTSIRKLNNRTENVVLDAPVEIGEGKETAKLLLDLTKSMLNYNKNFMKVNAQAYRTLVRNYKGIRDKSTRTIALKDIAQDANGLFLEWNYGIKPMMGLFSDAATLLAERFDQHVPREKMSGKEFFGDTVSNSVILWPYAPLASSLGSCTQLTTHTYKYTVWHGGLLISTARRETLQQQLGLNMNNIPSTLWELTRASFVVDYFINVGDVLSNLKASFAQLQPASLYKSTKWEYEGRIQLDGYNPPKDTSPFTTRYSGSGLSITAEGTTKYMQFTRSPIGGSQLLLLPRVQPQSWDHIAKTLSVAASMTGVFRR